VCLSVLRPLVITQQHELCTSVAAATSTMISSMSSLARRSQSDVRPAACLPANEHHLTVSDAQVEQNTDIKFPPANDARRVDMRPPTEKRGHKDADLRQCSLPAFHPLWAQQPDMLNADRLMLRRMPEAAAAELDLN